MVAGFEVVGAGSPEDMGAVPYVVVLVLGVDQMTEEVAAAVVTQLQEQSLKWSPST
jgi:hypothetical protein